MKQLSLLLIGIVLASCASAPRQSGPPATSGPKAPGDQVVRGVGNLRKLLALPVVVQQGSCDWPEVARDLDEAAIRYLRDWKGYELVRPAPGNDGAWVLAQQLGAWQEKEAGSGRPPAELRAKILVAAEGAGADGVLVIHASPECPGGADAGLLTLPARLAGSLNRTLSAGVYDAERGGLVWHQYIRPAGWDPSRYGARPPPRFETRQAGEVLLGPIENAVPAVLKPPPRPRRPAPPPPPAPAASPAPPEVVVAPAREPTPLAPTPLPPVAAPAASGGAVPPSAPPEVPAPGDAPETATVEPTRPAAIPIGSGPVAEPPPPGVTAPGDPGSARRHEGGGTPSPGATDGTPLPAAAEARLPPEATPPPTPEAASPEPQVSPQPPAASTPTPGTAPEPATHELPAMPPPAAAPVPVLPPPETPAKPLEGSEPGPPPVPVEPAAQRPPIRT